MAVGTFAIRYSFISLSSRMKISAQTKEIFSFIPAAILPALVAPAVFFHQGEVSELGGYERAVVLILAIFVCWWTRSTLATVVFGLVALYFVTTFF